MTRSLTNRATLPTVPDTKSWESFAENGLFIKGFGSIVERQSFDSATNRYRKADLFSIIGYDWEGYPIPINVWNSNAEFIKNMFK